MHDDLTHAERVVLTAIHEHDDRWVDQRIVEMATGLQKRAIAYALHELERRDLVTRLWSARRRQWSITTTGEMALRDLAARVLPSLDELRESMRAAAERS